MKDLTGALGQDLSAEEAQLVQNAQAGPELRGDSLLP